MKVVVGIDPHQDSGALINLIGRLRFPEVEAICASIAPIPVSSVPGPGAWSDELVPQVMDAERATACRALDRAAERFARYDVRCDQVLEVGAPAFHLASLAKSRLAELVAVGSWEVPAYLSFALGSVGRALTIQVKRSLLIAKRPHMEQGPIKAVFAFDGSDYCVRSVDELIRLGPLGLTHIELLAVDTPDRDSSPVTRMRGEGAFELGPERRHEILLEHAEPSAAKLRSAGYDVRTVCHSGEVTEVIRGQAIDSGADLVILGAQGHGWLERTLFGSVALAQAVSEPNSVLILRPVPPS